VYRNERALEDIADFLCRKGANIDIKTDTGISAYSIALANNSKTYKNLLEYHMKFGYWAKHPFSRRKKLLWIYKQSEFKKLPISLIKEICLYM
jgi:ankyrin repeat protein